MFLFHLTDVARYNIYCSECGGKMGLTNPIYDNVKYDTQTGKPYKLRHQKWACPIGNFPPHDSYDLYGEREDVIE